MRAGPAILAAGLLLAAVAAADEVPAVHVETLPTSLAGEWLFRIGHDPSWASPFRERRNWQHITVPGAWEQQGFAGYDGHAWYRVSLFLSSQLADESLGLDLGMIGDVDEVFFNGRRIGGTGSFPPRFEIARLAHRVYRIPREAVRFGEYNELAVHVFNETRFGGLIGPPPRIDRFAALLRGQVVRDVLVYCLLTFLATLALVQFILFLTHHERLEHMSLALFLTFAGLYMLSYATWGPAAVLGYNASFRLNVAAFLLSVALFPSAILRLAKRPIPPLVIALQTVLALGAAFALAWPETGDLYLWIYLGEVCTAVVGVIAVRSLVALFRRRSPWAAWLTAVTLLMLLVVGLDVLVDIGILARRTIVAGELYSPLGLVPFAIVLSLASAHDWANSRWGEPSEVSMGILPRDRFLLRLGAELDQARRDGSALTVAFMKMDLGRIPDQAGSLAARAVAVLRHALRQVDLLGRSDATTFLILLAETDERAGVTTLERLRRAVMEGVGGARRSLSISAGVAQFRPARHTAAEELLQEAEAALYAAISEGGDCTATAP